MSSIATAVPSGTISGGPDWCILDLLSAFGQTQAPWKYNECANATEGTAADDFQTICCDGNIIDTTQDMYGFARRGQTMRNYPLDLENLVCCREAGQRQMGGIVPFPNPTRCDAVLKPTPLASLAATNTKNAVPYLATFESGRWDSAISMNVDWIRTETPKCLWVQTTHPDVTMVDVRVPAAAITTLPPPTTDAFGRVIGSTTNRPPISATTTTVRSPTSSSAGVKSTGTVKVRLSALAALALGLLVVV